MQKYQITLEDIGRRKLCGTYSINANNLNDAVDATLIDCKQYLASGLVDICHVSGDNYYLSAGFHNVGTITITPIPDQEKEPT